MSASDADILLFDAALRRHASGNPDGPALRMPDGDLSYGALVALGESIAARLQASGCQPGDRIALLAATGVDAVAVMMGAILARCALVPLSTSIAAEARAGLIADCAPKLLFADANFASQVEAPGHSMEIVLLQEPGDRASPEHAVLSSWIHDPAAAYLREDGQLDDLFSIIYSSGTTGVPKGAAHSNRVRCAHLAANGKSGLGPGSRMLLTTALYSNATFTNLMAALYNGATVLSAPRFSPAAFLEQVERDGITDCFLVPLQFRRILDCPDFHRLRLRSLRNTTMSGAICDVPLKQRIRENWSGVVTEKYGMTEGGAAASADLMQLPAEKLGAAGQVAGSCEVVILDNDERPLPPGQPGEIVGWSPLMMLGYFNRPDLTEAITWTAPDGREFLKTGDIGVVDRDNYLFITDRKKDMIISGGMNIYASDIEQVIRQRAELLEAAVIAVPSERWGESPYALIVPRPGERPNEAELLDWINARVGKMARLSGLEFREELIYNHMGKLLKRDLRNPSGKNMVARSADTE